MTITADASTDTNAVEVHCLGPFSVTVNGHAVDHWRAGKARSLFQFLLANRGQVMTKERLEEVLWPVHGGSSSSLRVAVHALRKVIGQSDPESETPLRVEYRDVGYVLEADDVRIDVDEFEAAVRAGRRAQADGDEDAARAAFTRAVDLYTGDFLVQDDAEWVLEFREWSRSLMLEALAALREDAMRRRDAAAVAEWSRSILRLDPYHEPSYRSLMSVHARRGERGQAKVWFELCQRRLAELGVDVEAGTWRLYQGLLASAGHRSPRSAARPAVRTA
jgi:DNA-binding SARP family transcriptional activator